MNFSLTLLDKTKVTYEKDTKTHVISISAVGSLKSADGGTTPRKVYIPPELCERLVAFTANAIGGSYNLSSVQLTASLQKACSKVETCWNVPMVKDYADKLEDVVVAENRTSDDDGDVTMTGTGNTHRGGTTKSFRVFANRDGAYFAIASDHKRSTSGINKLDRDGSNGFTLHLKDCRISDEDNFHFEGTPTLSVNWSDRSFTLECSNTIVSASGERRQFMSKTDKTNKAKLATTINIMSKALADTEAHLGKRGAEIVDNVITKEVARRLILNSLCPDDAHWNTVIDKKAVQKALPGYSAKIVIDDGDSALSAPDHQGKTSAAFDDPGTTAASFDEKDEHGGERLSLRLVFEKENDSITGATLHINYGWLSASRQTPGQLVDNAAETIKQHFAGRTDNRAEDVSALEENMKTSIGKLEEFYASQGRSFSGGLSAVEDNDSRCVTSSKTLKCLNNTALVLKVCDFAQHGEDH